MTTPERPPIPFSLLFRRGLVTVGVGLVSTVVLLGMIRGLLGVSSFGPLTLGPVTFMTILAVSAATAVYGAVTRLWPWPDQLFIKLAAIVLVGSFLPLIGILLEDPDATIPAVGGLMLMHVAVAGICIAILTDRYSPIARAIPESEQGPDE